MIFGVDDVRAFPHDVRHRSGLLTSAPPGCPAEVVIRQDHVLDENRGHSHIRG